MGTAFSPVAYMAAPMLPLLHAGGADGAATFPPGDLAWAAAVLAALAAAGWGIHLLVRRRRGGDEGA